MSSPRPEQDQEAQESEDRGRDGEEVGADTGPRHPYPVYVFNPVGFNPDTALPEGLRRHGDCARYFVGRIAHENIFDPRTRGQFVPLKAAIMREYFPGKDAYKGVRDNLIEHGAVTCDGQYIVGEKSMGYRLGSEMEAARLHKVEIRNPKLAGKIRANRRDWIRTPEGVHRHLMYWLRRVEIDYPAALEWLLAQPKFEPTDEMAAQMIHGGDFFMHVCRYGRVHTNLSNLKRGLRGFLHYRGEPLVNLDIRNSQPLFFAPLLRDRFPGDDVPDDVRRYLELVQAGRFYDVLMEAWGVPAKRRGKFKKTFFAGVFYGENDPIRKKAQLFGEMFPNVYAAIRAEKESDFADLARSMQRAESRLMIGRVAVRIMEELPHAFCGTIHDSILTTEDHAEAIREIMLQEFEDIDLRPTINVEST